MAGYFQDIFTNAPYKISSPLYFRPMAFIKAEAAAVDTRLLGYDND